eukprot:jgi/Undpi1/10562/HiC_scaffold_29.g13012.m1
MAFKAFVVLVALCLVSLASGFVAPTAFARNVAVKQTVQMSAQTSLPAAVPAAAAATILSVCSPLASYAAEQSSALAQLPTELIADNGTATLAIVVGMFIPCSFLITLYFGTEQKKAGVIEGQNMDK